jgi:predicted transcriptional regulator of viral defense system
MALSSYSGSTLSNRESTLLASFERDERTAVQLSELIVRLGKPAAYEVVRSLTRKGVLQRVGRGRYLVRPFRSIGRAWTVSAPVAATLLLEGEPHYLGGRWAWWFHRLTQQVHGSRVDAFVTRWRPERKLANARVLFHRTQRPKLGVGVEIATIEGVPVRVSDMERTLLDVLDHPGLLGTLSDALERFEEVLARADIKRLVSHAGLVSRPSTCQRLGILLERRGASRARLAPLAHRIEETRSVLSLWPDRRREGPVHPRWRVVENDHAKPR